MQSLELGNNHRLITSPPFEPKRSTLKPDSMNLRQKRKSRDSITYKVVIL